MTKQSKITAVTETEIQQWPLADTYLSEHNPRGEVSEADEGIAELAQTIIASGLIHNLSGLLDEQGKVGIVAGGRRWRALQIAVKARPSLVIIPVKITDDLETALSWAMLENRERVELDKVDEIRAYGQSRDKGLNLAQIAKAYCVTEAHVRRRLALADLPAPVLDALKSGEIGLGEAKAFARSDDEVLILKVLEQVKDNSWWGEHQIKQALDEDKLDADCRTMRFVGLEAYKEAGGTLSTNLFDDDATVDNIDLLERLFAEKLEEEADKLQKVERIAWAKIIGDSYCHISEFMEENDCARLYPIAGVLAEEQQARYDALDQKWDWELSVEEKAEKAPLQDILDGDYSDAQRALSGAIVYVNRSGEVAAYLGIVKGDDLEQAIEAGFVTPNQHEATASAITANEVEQPAYSQKFMDDLKAIRLASLQTALLQKPELVLDLLAYGLAQSGQSTYSSNEVMAVGFSNQRNKPENPDEGFQLSPRIGGALSEEEEAAMDEEPAVCDSKWDGFEAFRKVGKKARNVQITESFARALKTLDNDFMSQIEAEAGASMRSIWTPNAVNCFKRMNAGQLETLFMSLFELEPDSAKLKAFAKAKKGVKADIMADLFNAPENDKVQGVTKNQRMMIDAWVPEC